MAELWISSQWQDLGLRHGQNLEELLLWAENIPGFHGVRRMLRQDEEFWPALSHLRMAWWLFRAGFGPVEFEPPTFGERNADIRCRIAGIDVDLEIVAPRKSAAMLRHYVVPKQLLVAELDSRFLDCLTVYLPFGPILSLSAITPHVVEIADRIVEEQQSGDLTPGEEATIRFPHIRIPTKRADGQVGETELEILIVGARRGEASLFASPGSVSATKPNRTDPDIGETDWITHTLLDKSRSLSRERPSGVLIETTLDDDLLAKQLDPTSWGIQAIIDEFWNMPQSKSVGFVGLFGAVPGGSSPRPGALRINRAGAVAELPALHEELLRFWQTWIDDDPQGASDSTEI